MSASPRLRRVVGAATAAVAVLAAGVLTAPAAHAATVDLQLLSVNDFHGRINASTSGTPPQPAGTVQFAGTIEQLRAADGANGANTLLLGAGDLIGASEFASAVARDQPTIDVFDALGMSASAVGNHEFDGGFADLRDRVIAGGTNAEWDYLGANVYGPDGEPVLPEYGTYQAAGLTVGVIGAVTVETPTLVSPGGVEGLTFGDPVEAVNRVAAQLSDGDPANGEADVLVASYHEGAPLSDPPADLAANLAASAVFASMVNDTSPLVDAILNGHTHQAYAYSAPVPGTNGQTRPVLQTGQYASNVGRITLSVDTATKTVSAFTVGNTARTTASTASLVAAYPRVAEVDRIVTAALAAAATVGNQPVGTLTADITTAMTPGTATSTPYPGFARDDRTKESTLGTLVADAVLSALTPADRGGAEIAVVNPGGLRSELVYAATSNPADAAGRILYSEANAVLPFVNNLATVDLTGAQLKTLLEQQWQRDASGNVPTRAYLQLGTSTGFSYTFDTTRPEGDRVTSMTLNGASIDPARAYRVGSFTFLTGFGNASSAGGDNFRIFQQATNYRDSGLVDRDAWIAYLQANQPVSPDFRKHAVAVTGLDTTAVAGTTQRVEVGLLDSTSIGAVPNTSITAEIATAADGTGAVAAGSASVTNGAASIDVTFPAAVSGPAYLVLTAQPSGTRAVVPIEIAVPAPTTTFGFPSRFVVKEGAVFDYVAVVVSRSGAVEGPVSILDGGTVIATATLTAADRGVIRVALPGLDRGVHRLSARFDGTDAFAASSGPRLPVFVR